ncbi:MAG: tRNA1(Val) (adenine(37)-N6)-methyltransferase [Emergencia sp.]
MAQRNIRENQLEGRLHLFHENVKDFSEQELFGTFDVVTSNPPYTAGNCGIESSNPAKAVARHEISASLDDFIRLAANLLKDRGSFYLVHRPSRLVDICESCRRYKLEPKALRFVSGKPMEKPNILLVHCVKNGNPELKFLNPAYIHDADGSYCPWVMKLYERDI